VTLSNPGSAALTIASMIITGDFAQTNTCGVPAGGSCTIYVTFKPTATGTRSGTLTLTDNNNEVAGSTQTISLSGTGIAPLAGVTPSSLTFAAQLATTTSTAQTVTLSNTGTAPLTLSSISASSNFSQSNNCGASLAVSGSCTISVTFTPQAGASSTSTGSLTGTLTITDNNNGVTGSTQTVSLSGTEQDFSLAPASGASSTFTAPRGQPATYSLAVGGLGGFIQSISFICAGAPAGASCTVVPSVLTPSSTLTSVTVFISTTAPSSGAPGMRRAPPRAPLGGPPGWGLLALLLTLGTGALWKRRQAGAAIPGWAKQGARARVALALAAGLLLTLAALACHRPYISGTPAGTYTVTVIGSATSGSTILNHSVNLTLTVY
jgi:hypothetical protein